MAGYNNMHLKFPVEPDTSTAAGAAGAPGAPGAGTDEDGYFMNNMLSLNNIIDEEEDSFDVVMNSLKGSSDKKLILVKTMVESTMSEINETVLKCGNDVLTSKVNDAIFRLLKKLDDV